MTNIPLVILLGVVFSIQTHLAKALERQGIEVFDQIKARIQKRDGMDAGLKKPLIYTIGVGLNNTVFIWAVLAQPHGPPALFTSMFGVGLVFLILYAAFILKEPVTRFGVAGATLIFAGTLVIGVENISRVNSGRFNMDVNTMAAVLLVWIALGVLSIIWANRYRDLTLIALIYGAFAGGLGGLDPFLKGVGQNLGGGEPGILPSTFLGTLIFLASFLIGFIAFLVTQFGFARKAPASVLVPAYNAMYIVLPVILQIFLLPAYAIYWTTVIGIGLIIIGIILMYGGGSSHPAVWQSARS